MKRVLNSGLSVVLAVTIIFSSVYIGLGDLDFSGIFAVRAQAADYSDLTPNQYMAKVMLNHNYIGMLNDYGASNSTYQEELLEFYYVPDNASSARIFYDTFQEDNDFQSTLDLYKRMSFDLGDAVSEKMELEDYYTSILLNIIDAKMSDNNFVDSLNCEINKNIVELSKGVSKILEGNAAYDVSNLCSIPMTILTDEEAMYIIDEIIESSSHKNLCKLVGKDVSIIGDIMFWADNVNDGIKNICAYTSLADTSVAVENVLYEIYTNCPSSNVALKSASYNVYKYVSEQMGYAILSMISAGEQAIESTTKLLLSSLWEECLTGVLGSVASYLKLAQVIGKGIGNFCCGTDAILEQLVVMGCLVDFEDVMASTVNSLALAYKLNSTEANADNYIKSVDMLLSTYNLDHIYSSDFITLVYTGGVVTSIMYSDSDTLQNWVNAFAKRRANLPRWLTRFPSYATYYEADAQSGYDVYFGSSGSSTDIVEADYITLNKHLIELVPNMTETLTVTVYPLNATYRDTISFWSSDETIVEVDVTEGIITAIAPGTATITAVAAVGTDIIETTCSVIVLPFFLFENENGYTIDDYIGTERNFSIPTEFAGVPITSIGEEAFFGCTSLASITIPDSVTSIGDLAFYSCDNLTSITIPDSITSIGEQAFSKCTSLTSIKIPDNVMSIGSYAFQHCNNLTSITIPDSVTSIGDYAFSWCERLASLIIGKGVTSIGEGTFCKCDSLTTITIPDSVTSIGNWAFHNCDSLTSLIIGNGVTSIGDDAFSYCTSLTSVTIPDSVTSIGDWTFNNCKRLTSLVIGNGVTNIGSSAFEDCTSLEEIVVPDSVTNLGASVFRRCVSLKKAVLPESITVIGENAFSDCDSVVVFCKENGKAHIYADSNRVPYILNTESTIIDLTDERIRTDILGGSLDNIILGSDAVTYTIDTDFAGTGTIVDVLLNGEDYSQYTLVVNGDTNGDSVCDVLDCVDVEKTSNGNADLTGVYAEAGDINGDDVINVNDYSAIVNKALAS